MKAGAFLIWGGKKEQISQWIWRNTQYFMLLLIIKEVFNKGDYDFL